MPIADHGLVAGAAGYSLVIGGPALVWKCIELINEELLALLLVFGGLLVPLDRMPDWAASITSPRWVNRLHFSVPVTTAHQPEHAGLVRSD